VSERLIAIDVGAGTADIVVRRDDQPAENSVKLVVPSQTQVVAARIRAATGGGAAVVFAGPTMGGGADTRAMKAHTAAGLPFLATATAALSFADDLDRVRARGVQIVADDEAARLAERGSLSTGGSGSTGGRRPVAAVRSGDVDAAALLSALRRLGVETRFDGAAVAVQDHGFCPGSSNRVFRFSLWERAVRERRALHDLFFWATPGDVSGPVPARAAAGGTLAEAEGPEDGAAERLGIPAALTRMRAAAGCAAPLLAGDGSGDAAPDLGGGGSAPRLLAGDTGPAALLGALTDIGAPDTTGLRASGSPLPPAAGADGSEAGDPEGVAVLVNVGNGHTIAAVARGGRLAGVYEHHTGLLDPAKLELQLRRFLAGDLSSEEVRADGGHGAVLDAAVPLAAALLVTGPNRALLRATGLEVRYPAPWGDMMIAGAVGLIEAFRRKTG
jgi:uncharacterized protein (DUF1786 family)